jgi:hypothetical protein
MSTNTASIWPGGAKADATKLIEATEKLLKDVKRDQAVPVVSTGLRDMPDTVLDGRLGEICSKHMSNFPISLAWPALLAGASALCDQYGTGVRANLYVALVGPPHAGKSQSIEHALSWLGVDPPVRKEVYTGSAEQLVRELKDASGNPRLLCVDELGHLLAKAQIQNASFPFILSNAFYKDKFDVSMSGKEKVQFDCALSIVGGLVEEKFQDSFGPGTTGGLYDRFIFGQCPDGYRHDYFPFAGTPQIRALNPVAIRQDVWTTKSEWMKQDKELNPRVIELVIRAAAVCAAFSGERTLTPEMLRPARELLRYQSNIRKLLKPNPGENFEAQQTHKFLDYLDRAGGEWVGKREMFRDTRAYDKGGSTGNRALSVLHANDDIEITSIGKRVMVRRIYHDGGSR